jgi:transposase
LRDKIKILYWHNNGFWLFYRRLEKQRFWWPADRNLASSEITSRELSWLLEGLDVAQVKAHKTAKFALF